MLELTGLCKSYLSREGETQALAGLDLLVRPGEIVGVLGPNGAGKTTAVKMIMGFLAPSAGTIRYQEQLLRPAEPRPFIGYLPENFRPNPNLTVAEYVCLQAKLAGRDRSSAQTESGELLRQVAMADVPDRLIANLSKGMGQRVGLAQALAGDPTLLVLDEPTSGLDPIGKSMVIDLLLSKKEEGKTILFCSHILSEVRRLCDRIGVLVGGRLGFFGTVEEFLGKWSTDDLEQAFRQEVLCGRP